jgi:hypothetical protein
LRLHLLVYLNECASHQHTIEVPVKACFDIFHDTGCTENHIVSVLRALCANGLLRNISAADIEINSTVALTRSGGYYTSILVNKFVYVEECMHDTAIDDEATWHEISHLTKAIEASVYVSDRMKLRINRANHFLRYLSSLETSLLHTDKLRSLSVVDRIIALITKDMQDATLKIDKYYADRLVHG